MLVCIQHAITCLWYNYVCFTVLSVLNVVGSPFFCKIDWLVSMCLFICLWICIYFSLVRVVVCIASIVCFWWCNYINYHVHYCASYLVLCCNCIVLWVCIIFRQCIICPNQLTWGVYWIGMYCGIAGSGFPIYSILQVIFSLCD